MDFFYAFVDIFKRSDSGGKLVILFFAGLIGLKIYQAFKNFLSLRTKKLDDVAFKLSSWQLEPELQTPPHMRKVKLKATFRSSLENHLLCLIGIPAFLYLMTKVNFLNQTFVLFFNGIVGFIGFFFLLAFISEMFRAIIEKKLLSKGVPIGAKVHDIVIRLRYSNSGRGKISATKYAVMRYSFEGWVYQKDILLLDNNFEKDQEVTILVDPRNPKSFAVYNHNILVQLV